MSVQNRSQKRVQKRDKHNVIDLSERRAEIEARKEQAGVTGKLREALAKRLDVEQAKIAVSTSLISIVVLATFANNSIWTTETRGSANSSSIAMRSNEDRGIASVSATGLADSERAVTRELARRELDSRSTLGRRPSSLDELALGFLEGKYSMRLERGKIQSLEFASGGATSDEPKYVDRVRFLEQMRELLPVRFDRLAKGQGDEPRMETYELLSKDSDRAQANVEFRMDEMGRLLSMKVRVPQYARN